MADKTATPSTAIVVEGSVRAFQEWTPQLIRGAEQLADSGNITAAADLVDAMMADDRLLGVMNKLVLGLLGLDLSFEASRGRRKPVKALDVGEDWWSLFPESEIGDVAKWGFLLGVGIGRIAPWTERDDGSGRVVGRLVPWHPRNLRQDQKTKQWYARVEGGKEVPVNPGDGEWVLFTPYGEKRPWAKGLWRGLSRWWLLKQYAIADWGKYSERHGQGTWVAEPHVGASPGKEDRKQLAADLQGMGRNAGVAMPPGYNLKLAESVANTYQTFKAQSDAANAGYAISVLGNNLTTEVTGGSFAATDVHKVVEAARLRFAGESISTFTHDQVLTWWAEFNYGNRALAPWPQWATDPPEDLKSSADLFVAFGAALDGFAKFKIPVDVAALCERFRIPLLAGQPIPEMLEAPPPPPNPFGAPPADGGGEPPPKPKAARKRSKAKTPSTTGLRDGQQYADELASAARDRARKALEPDLKAIMKAIADGEDLADIRDRLAKAYQAMSPTKLAALMGDTMALSNLAGRTALKQDT